MRRHRQVQHRQFNVRTGREVIDGQAEFIAAQRQDQVKASINAHLHLAVGRGRQSHRAVLPQAQIDRRLQIEQRTFKLHRYAQIANGSVVSHLAIAQKA